MDDVLERLESRLPDRAVPVWELAKRTVQDSLHDRVPGLAAEAAFFALLSLVPMLLAVAGFALDDLTQRLRAREPRVPCDKGAPACDWY